MQVDKLLLSTAVLNVAGIDLNMQSGARLSTRRMTGPVMSNAALKLKRHR